MLCARIWILMWTLCCGWESKQPQQLQMSCGTVGFTSKMLKKTQENHHSTAGLTGMDESTLMSCHYSRETTPNCELFSRWVCDVPFGMKTIAVSQHGRWYVWVSDSSWYGVFPYCGCLAAQFLIVLSSRLGHCRQRRACSKSCFSKLVIPLTCVPPAPATIW